MRGTPSPVIPAQERHRVPRYGAGIQREPRVHGAITATWPYAAVLSSITNDRPTALSAFSTWLMCERWFGSTILRTALS